MKKQILCILGIMILLSIARPAAAQIYQAGLPLSMQKKLDEVPVPVSYYPAPDWEAYKIAESKRSSEVSFTRPYTGGLVALADFGFPGSGYTNVLPDGSRVWQGMLAIPEAPAIGLLLDQFRLPEGVKLYLSNANRKQVLGAFDHSNNDASGKFAIDVIQGAIVRIELNISPDVNLDDIILHIDRVMVMHRGIEHLSQYLSGQPVDLMDDDLNGKSSVCMINAICPQGYNYTASRKATVQTVQAVGNEVALCSGTLINNTANTAENCRPLLLTAGHCEGSGSINNDDFAQFMVRFNFEKSTCDNSGTTNGVTMTGLYIRARSVLSGSFPVNDFMLYELRQAIPTSYDVVLAGWNRSDSIPLSLTPPKKFIGFHHPAGDNKKLSTSQELFDGFNSTGPLWLAHFDEGYASGGTSGSGLFDGDGLLIGIASFAGNIVLDSCRFNALNEEVWTVNGIQYLKLWHSWQYMPQETENYRRLNPWLDPLNTGVEQLGALSACISTPIIEPVNIEKPDDEMERSVSVFPNPAIDGRVSLQYNLKKTQRIEITVFDLNGKAVFKHHINKASSGVQGLDLQSLANGLYMIRISGTDGFTTKKLMINR